MQAGSSDVPKSAAAIAQGMGTTFREFISPTITENYPIEPPKVQKRYRGGMFSSGTRMAW
jgi:formate hydrogenlyase subunit 6/NADH:ubiquinone oxidoreductase subunit I